MPVAHPEPCRLDPAPHLGEPVRREGGELVRDADAVLGDLGALPPHHEPPLRPLLPATRPETITQLV